MLLNKISHVSKSPHYIDFPMPIDGALFQNISQIFLNAARLIHFENSDTADCHRFGMAKRVRAALSALAASSNGVFETDPAKVAFFPCGYRTATGRHAIYCEFTKTQSLFFNWSSIIQAKDYSITK